MDKADYVPPKETAPIIITEKIPAPPVQLPVDQTFKLPDDFGQKMEDIRKIMGMLQDLKNNFGIVSLNKAKNSGLKYSTLSSK